MIVPGYFFVALLRVYKGQYNAIGLLFKHEDNTDAFLGDYAMSIDQLEALTGFDFFCNLSYEINTADVWQKYQLTELHSGKVIESGISKEPIGNNIGVCFGVRYHIR